MSAVRKRTFTALAGALVAAALVVAPLVTAGASAAPPADDGDAVTIVGEIGVLEDFTPEANKASYWEARYAAFNADCFAHDKSDRTPHGSITDDGLTVTLSEFDESWGYDGWVALIVKGATTNNVVESPEAGVAYASPPTGSGVQSEVSHWIVCKGDHPEGEPTVVTPTLTVTPPTCLADGFITRSDDVNWTSEENGDGTTTWTALPNPGTIFEAGVKVSWTVPDLAQLTDDCESEEPEQPEPLKSESSKTTFDCATTTATVTTTTTTTEYIWNAETETWVLGEPTSEDVVTERDLTEAEIDENCPLVPGDIDSVCVGDVPYLGYAVTLPEGFEADSETPVTITFVNPDGEDYVVENQPLSGELLWPGASATAPKMWPGWELVNGEYVQTDGNFAWTRAGVTVRFEVNPSYSTEVQYPEASAECANPPVGGGTPASTDTEALAVTGGGVSPIVVAAGGAALFAGIAVVAIAAYRRRHASMQ